MRWRSTVVSVAAAALMLASQSAHASPIEKIWSYNPPGRSWIASSGAALGGLVFVLNKQLGASTGSVAALDEKTGATVWSVTITGLPPLDRPLVAGDLVLIGNGGGVTALDPTTGGELWHADWPCGPQVDVATTRVAYAVTGQICRLNLTTHRVTRLHRNPFGGDDGWDILIVGGRLFVSYPNNGVVVFSGRTGRILWRAYAGPYHSGDSNRLALDGNLLLVGKQAIDLSTRQVAQSWDPSRIRSLVSGAGIVTSDEVIFEVFGQPHCSLRDCAAGFLSLEAVDPFSGSVEWDSEVASDATSLAPPVVNDGTIYVNTITSDGASRLISVNAGTGTVGSSVAAPAAFSGSGSDFTSPLFAADSAVFVNGHHRLAAYA